MKKQILFLSIVFTFLLSMNVACTVFSSATPTALPVPTIVPVTIVPTATALPLPTSAPIPTATSAAPATSAPVPAPTTVVPQGSPGGQLITRPLQFSPGGTSATVQGNVAANGTDRYSLRAQAGQTMLLNVTATQGQVILAVTGANGTVLLPARNNATSWSGALPLTQDYLIDIKPVGTTGASYTLHVTVPPLATAASQPVAKRIQFQPGTTSAGVQGNLPAFGLDRYVLRAQAGQTMVVQLTTVPAGKGFIVIFGADGDVLISDHAGASNWSGTLRTAQDYNIDVRTGDTAASYTLQVTIPPAGATAVPAAKRISFPPGGTSATVQGTLAANGIDQYVLRAQTGQTMLVAVTSAQGNMLLSIHGADGQVLKSSGAGTASWSGQLPATQDYFLTISTPSGTPANYTLQVTIP